MEKATVLVTGGLGYIGSHTVVALQQANYEVVVVDNLSNASIDVLERIKSITGKRPKFANFDLQDLKKTQAFFKKNPQIEGVIHFAAYKSVNESVAHPLDYYQNNVGSLLNLLRVMQEMGCKRLVFSSSCSVYGQPSALPVTENTALRPASPYGNTKKICEEVLQDFTHSHPHFDAISLRYFNPIGAHSSGKLGEESADVPNNLVPLLLQKALGIRETFYVFGSDYNTADGTCIRDYLHVEDLAEAHIMAMAYLLEDKSMEAHEIFNLGTGTGRSILEVIQSFERVSGVKLSYMVAPRRAGDVGAIYADATQAEQRLGWKANKTLDDMILSAWHWEQYKQNVLKK